MNNLLEHIAARHINPVQQIQPRLPGRYETQHSSIPNDPFIDFNLEEYKEVISSDNQAKTKTVSDNNFNKQNTIQDINPLAESNSFSKQNQLPESNTLENKTFVSPPLHPKEEHSKILRETNNQQYDEVANEAEKMTAVNTDQRKVLIEHSSYTRPGNSVLIKNHLLQENYLPTHLGEMSDLTLPQIYTSGQSVIKVSIGRIDVRAVATSSPVKTNTSPTQKERMSLDDYFKKRNKS